MSASTIAVACLLGFTLVLLYLLLRSRSLGAGGAERAVREELRAGRDESAEAARHLRQEVAAGLKDALETMVKTLQGLGAAQKGQLETVTQRLEKLTESSRTGIDRLRETVEAQLRLLQEGNERKLEQMRKTVDEKLQGTLERRLGESFKLVSERLAAVQRGLGEMKSLAEGVGDLKRVLTNVKTRGTWGEVQLGTLLEDLLAPDQYARNVAVRRGASERVEFAIRLPGDGGPEAGVWLPIDSKFPQEDYARLQDAVEKADAEAAHAATAAIARSIRASAQTISQKYLCPPDTTDFGIMFLPTEGLYAEVIHQPGLPEELQRRYRIIVTGPTTFAALLTSLRMGFQALAIEQRSGEVWKVLSAVKTEFDKFGSVLSKLHRQLELATRTVEQGSKRTQAMQRKLREVERLPAEACADVLELPAETVPAVELEKVEEVEKIEKDRSAG